MAADVITPAILDYISHGAYPDTESISSADLSTSALASLSEELIKAQNHVKSAIRSISHDASSDIDTWIERAKELQADILRSRETARQIVEEAEKGKELKSKAQDCKGKVELLEREVRFQDTVHARLEHVRHTKVLLESVHDAVVERDVVSGLTKLEEAEESIGGLDIDEGAGVGAMLVQRTGQLKLRLREIVNQCWNERLIVKVEERNVTVKGGLENLITASKGLGIFDGLLTKLAKDFERTIVRPGMTLDRSGRAPPIQIVGDQITCNDSSEEMTLQALIKGFSNLLDFLAAHLPVSVSRPLAEILLPPAISRLEDEWLQPAIPLEISEMPAFQGVLSNVSGFAEKIDRLGWPGGKPLRDWVQGAARYWLTKRREALLDDVRNLVFNGLRETKTVERVETQMISHVDGLDQGQKVGDDEWDTAWDEPDENAESSIEGQQPATQNEEDDDASAWDVPDDEDPLKEAAGNDDSSAWDVPEDGHPLTEATAEDEDAWGWGDGEDNATMDPGDALATGVALSQVNGQPASFKNSQREMTLRETFTVTVVPDEILELIQRVITDAGTLAEPHYATTPIGPAATALFTLPTLALAIYRATAPTAYNKLATGNMLIYNDANRLSDQLRSWQASQAPASRLRLDNDVKALDQFAKRAYTSEMESQRIILRDMLDGAQGFSNCTTQPYKSECESAVEQTVDHLRTVRQQWEPILSSSALLQSIGSLLATVIGKMITEIEDLPDIGEQESKELKSLCDNISAAKDMFVQTTPDGDVREMTFIYCPNWLKFQYLAEIMESSLADIRYLWREGELSLEFEGEEIVGLVEALFAESTLRRQAIQEIRRGARQ